VDPNTTDREFLVLNLIQASEVPIGSWALVESIAEKGISLSSATVGRILNHLEKQGYLVKDGSKGRVITQKGEAAMKNALKYREMEGYKKKLDDLLTTNMLNHFIMVLETRKVIERSTVALAVGYITDGEIEKLRRIEARRDEDYKKSRINAHHDIEFHQTIANASRNEVLKIFSQIISMIGQQSDLFDYMRAKMETPYYISHKKILKAIDERNAELAEKAMVEHIDTLIRDVKVFWKEYASHMQ
jgi:DNA-binding FadR family transcriptional regulator